MTPGGTPLPPRRLTGERPRDGNPTGGVTSNPPPIVTWAATAPGLPIGAASQPTIGYREAAARTLAGGIEIRRVRLREIPRVAAIQREAFPKRLAYTAPTLFGLTLLPVIRFLVAVRGREVLGCAIGDRSGLDARVINIAVTSSARRQGIAATLLFELEDALPGGDMVLMVQRENAGAHDLYHQIGYVDVGLALGYYGPGRDGVWMRKPRPTPLDPPRPA